MGGTRVVLDYAPAPSGWQPTARRVAIHAAILLPLAVVSAGVGALVARIFSPPVYRALGHVIVDHVDPISFAPPHWPLQQIVPLALASARRSPFGASLPTSAGEAVAHAAIEPIRGTELVSVEYSDRNPLAAAAMAREMINACVATPLATSDGKNCHVAAADTPRVPDRPQKNPALLLGGVGGGFAGAALGESMLWLWRIRGRKSQLAPAGQR
jgi:uncharacterized protein involved in exopolysaccharide biosynthesis